MTSICSGVLIWIAPTSGEIFGPRRNSPSARTAGQMRKSVRFLRTAPSSDLAAIGMLLDLKPV